MPGLQELLEIAMRYATAMSDAMILACFERAHEVGVRLHAPARPGTPRGSAGRGPVGRRPAEDVDFERLVRTNADTPKNHC